MNGRGTPLGALFACLVVGTLAWWAVPVESRTSFDSERVRACERAGVIEPVEECRELERAAALCEDGSPLCGRAEALDERRELCRHVYAFMAKVPDGPTVGRDEGSATWCASDERDLCPSGADRHDNPFPFASGCEWIEADGRLDVERSGLSERAELVTRSVLAFGAVLLFVALPLGVLRKRRSTPAEDESE